MVFVTKGIARRDILDPNYRGDVPGITGVDVFPLVRLDLNQAADALALVRARIVNRVAFRKRSGINAEKNELADEWIAPEFEGEGAEVAVVVGRRFHLFVRVGFHADSWRNI